MHYYWSLVLLSLVKYLYSVNLAADFLNMTYIWDTWVRGTVDWFSRITVERESDCAMTWKAGYNGTRCIYLSTGQATAE